MKKKLMAAAIAITFALPACAQNGQPNQWGMGNKQTMGTLGGAVLGGVLGSGVGKGGGRLWATGAGALLGGLLGSEVGKSLDQSDQMYNEQAWQRAYSAPLNNQISWSNPDNGHAGYITPVREGRSLSTGYPCREYKQTIVVNGQAETAYGTACEDSSGVWQLVNPS